MTASEVITEIWRRATSSQPAPGDQVIVILAVAALIVVASPLWPLVRMLATITHEGGHAVAALLMRRRLTGIKLNRDTSGVTLSKGHPRGAGMVITLVAGYPAPALTGAGAALLLDAGYAIGVLWLATALLSVMLLMMRNFYGIVVVLAVGSAIAALSWFGSVQLQSIIAYGACWLLLWSAPRPIVELARRPERGSDVDQLHRLTGIPRGVWLAFFGLITLTCVAVGAWLLLPVRQWLGY